MNLRCIRCKKLFIEKINNIRKKDKLNLYKNDGDVVFVIELQRDDGNGG